MNEPIPIVRYKKFGLVILAIVIGFFMLVIGSLFYDEYERNQQRKQEIAEIEAYITEHSIEQTEPSRLNRLAWLYRYDSKDKPNTPRRIELLRAAIQQGDLESQYDLGVLLVDQGDKTEGMTLIRAASKAGHKYAAHYLDFLSRAVSPVRQVRKPIIEPARIYNLTSNCKSVVETKAPIPDKISFSYTSFSYDDNSLKGDVDFMNQYGAWMPYRFLCSGNDWGEITGTSVYQGYWKD